LISTGIPGGGEIMGEVLCFSWHNIFLEVTRLRVRVPGVEHADEGVKVLAPSAISQIGSGNVRKRGFRAPRYRRSSFNLDGLKLEILDISINE
jgi:hypothetical protein